MSRSLFLLVMLYERNFEPRTGVDACQASYRPISYSSIFGALRVTWVFGEALEKHSVQYSTPNSPVDEVSVAALQSGG
jgi:hypothetical protein